MMRLFPVCLFLLLLGCGGDGTANNAALGNAPANGAQGNKHKEDARAEAEVNMGYARDRARVAYSREATARKTLSGATGAGGCDHKPAELKGDYFQVRDLVYNDGKADLGGAVACEPLKDETLGFGAAYFNYSSGQYEHKWYATKKELDDALKAFEQGK